MPLPFSTNPMTMAENIRKLEDFNSGVEGRVVSLEAIAPKDYSTTEQDTGVKWVDGSAIYRKCVEYDGSAFTAATYKTVAVIENINIVIEGYCTSKISSAHNYYVLKPNSVRSKTTTGDVDFRFDSAIGATEGGYTVIYYTKETPSALTASPDRLLNSAPEQDAAPEFDTVPEQEAEPVLKKATRKKSTTNKEEE